MEYDPVLIANWVAAVTLRANLVRNNAPLGDQQHAEKIVKTGLVRLLVSVGVDFDDAMRAASLSEEDYTDMEG